MALSKNTKVLKFIEHVKSECKRLNVRFKLGKGKFVKSKDGMTSSGYFCDKEMTLACAMGGRTEEQWLGILVHEYGHLCQWMEKSKWWCPTGADIFTWLEGKKEFSKQTVMKFYRASRDVEWNCENRTLKNIKLWDLPIDMKLYTQRANAYIAFYSVVLKTKKWYTNPPYYVQALLDLMPSDRIISRSECDNPPKGYAELAVKACFK